MRKFLHHIVLVTIVICFPLISSAQKEPKPQKTKKSRKQFEKKTQDREAEALSQQEEGRKKHYKLQEKQVRKRMRRAKRTAKRNNNNKKQFFLKRWFTKH